MNSALIHNGKVITAREYNSDNHGSRLYCIDKSCKVPVIFIPGGENTTPHFKTTGRNDSKHVSTCGFYKPLSFIESIKKVEEYQEDFLEQGMKETVLRINFNKLDPDYESRTVEKESSDKKKNPDEIKVKQDNDTPLSISSLKSVVKLMTSYEPDVLSTILVNIRGNKLPLSNLILDQKQAHDLLWEEDSIPNIGYFVFGEVDTVLRREKVMYINFKPLNNVRFSLVVFDKYFKHFTYTDKELENKLILAWGHLRKNTYNEKNTTEMTIKSNRYIEFLYR